MSEGNRSHLIPHQDGLDVDLVRFMKLFELVTEKYDLEKDAGFQIGVDFYTMIIKYLEDIDGSAEDWSLGHPKSLIINAIAAFDKLKDHIDAVKISRVEDKHGELRDVVEKLKKDLHNINRKNNT